MLAKFGQRNNEVRENPRGYRNLDYDNDNDNDRDAEGIPQLTCLIISEPLLTPNP